MVVAMIAMIAIVAPPKPTGPTEPYNRKAHYGRTPTAVDRDGPSAPARVRSQTMTRPW